MKAISTRYYGPTNTKPSRIKASAEGVPSKIWTCSELDEAYIYPDSYLHDRHVKAAKLFAHDNHWSTNLASGQLPNGDWVHCFIPVEESLKLDGFRSVERGESLADLKVDTVPVTAALLGELADIRDRGNSPKVAGEACIEAQKGFGPSPAHLAQLRDTLTKPRTFTVVSVSSNANSFGYKGALVLTEDGTGFECLYSFGNEPKRGDKIPEKDLPTYCRRELPKTTPEQAVKIIKGI